MRRFKADDKFNISGRGIIFTGEFKKEEREYISSLTNKEDTLEIEFDGKIFECKVKGLEMFRHHMDREIANIGICVQIINEKIKIS